MTSLLQITLASLLLVAAAAGSRSPRKWVSRAFGAHREVTHCGTPLSDQTDDKIGAMYADMDGHNDCCITMDEATVYYMANKAGTGWETWNEERVREGLEKGFGEGDTNKDGCVTRVEMGVNYCAIKKGIFTVSDDELTLIAPIIMLHNSHHDCDLIE